MSSNKVLDTSQYLSFKLADEVFAIDVSKVREVLDLTIITKIPRTPEFMRGVINLRGMVVPVVDLRLCLGMSEIRNTVRTCIIVVEMLISGDPVVVGALADSVEEVLDLEADHIQPPPKLGSRIRTEFLQGVGRRDAEFIMILDIDRIFSQEELLFVPGLTGDNIIANVHV